MAEKNRAKTAARRERGRPFQKGQSGNPRGRPRGRPNGVTVEVRAAATALVDDPLYRAKLQADLRKRRVAPPIEAMLWHYAKGKPVERVEVGDPGEFVNMTDDELRKELAALSKQL